MTEEKPITFIGQLIFIEKIAKSEHNSCVLAKVALALAGQGASFPLALHELIECLPWDDYQTVLAMLSLRANCVIQWNSAELELLRGLALSIKSTF